MNGKGWGDVKAQKGSLGWSWGSRQVGWDDELTLRRGRVRIGAWVPGSRCVGGSAAGHPGQEDTDRKEGVQSSTQMALGAE